MTDSGQNDPETQTMALYTPYFSETHQEVRRTVRKFVDQHIKPFINEWEEA